MKVENVCDAGPRCSRSPVRSSLKARPELPLHWAQTGFAITSGFAMAMRFRGLRNGPGEGGCRLGGRHGTESRRGRGHPVSRCFSELVLIESLALYTVVIIFSR